MVYPLLSRCRCLGPYYSEMLHRYRTVADQLLNTASGLDPRWMLLREQQGARNKLRAAQTLVFGR